MAAQQGYMVPGYGWVSLTNSNGAQPFIGQADNGYWAMTDPTTGGQYMFNQSDLGDLVDDPTYDANYDAARQFGLGSGQYQQLLAAGFDPASIAPALQRYLGQTGNSVSDVMHWGDAALQRVMGRTVDPNIEKAQQNQIAQDQQRMQAGNSSGLSGSDWGDILKGFAIVAGAGGLGNAVLGNGLTATGTAAGTGFNASGYSPSFLGAGGQSTGAGLGLSAAGGGEGLLAGAGSSLGVAPGFSGAAGGGGFLSQLTEALKSGASAGASTGPGGQNFLTWKDLIGAGANYLTQSNQQNRMMDVAQRASEMGNPLTQPQRAPFQAMAQNLLMNPETYFQNNPFATALSAHYKNNVIPANVAKSGNPSQVIDEKGSQFATALAGNYNNLADILGTYGGYNQGNGGGQLYGSIASNAAKINPWEGLGMIAGKDWSKVADAATSAFGSFSGGSNGNSGSSTYNLA